MYDSLKEKQVIEEDQQKLIQHIEAKLQLLRNQRKRFEQHHLNTILQQQRPLYHIKSSKALNIATNHSSKPQLNKQSFSNTDYLHYKRHQNQVQENLKNLQDLYKKKKQLQAIGVIPVTLDQVTRLYNDPKNRKKIDQYDPQAKLKKDQILKQQMQRIQFMLKKKKVTKQQIEQMTEYYYKNLMKDKLKTLKRYQELLIYNQKGLRLNLLEKQEIIDIVFDTLKNFNDRLNKSFIKDFLLANSKFCQLFYITQEEIFNDLEVYQCQTEGQLTRNQFYQYIKSIQVSNPALNPSLKRRTLQQKSKYNKAQKEYAIGSSRVLKQSIRDKEIEEQRLRKSEMSSYLKKLFQYQDQKHQGLIQRQRFLIALRKGLLLDTKKTPLLKKQYLEQFALYLQKLRQNKNQRSYFMKLESKFMAWSQIDEMFRNFYKGRQGQQGDQKLASETNSDEMSLHHKYESESFSEFAEDKEEQGTYVRPKEIIRQGKLQEYFQQYGWDNQKYQEESNEQQKPFSSELKAFDSYYKEVREKHGKEIEWNNNIRDKLSLDNNTELKDDFNKLQSYIKTFEEDHQEY